MGLRMKRMPKPDRAEGIDRTTSDQGGARGTREPSRAVRRMVSGGDEEGRSQGGAYRSTGHSGVMGS